MELYGFEDSALYTLVFVGISGMSGVWLNPQMSNRPSQMNYSTPHASPNDRPIGEISVPQSL